MGMSTWAKGFRPPDAKWTAMKGIYDACMSAGVSLPDEVYEFFDGGAPDPAGIEVDLKELKASGAITEWRDDCRDGFELDLAKLADSHPNVTKVRFYNSW